MKEAVGTEGEASSGVAKLDVSQVSSVAHDANELRAMVMVCQTQLRKKQEEKKDDRKGDITR